MVLLPSRVAAQTFGPNSPSSGTNNASVGTLAWTTPSNVLSSNNSYANISSKGVTNYLTASNFGFSIPVTTSINGIQLDVEKSTLSPTVVTILNNWSAGLTKAVSAGTNRMLLFFVSTENGNGARLATAVSYGGQSLTSIAGGTTGATGGFAANMQFWILLESGIASATSTAFSVTFATTTLVENVEYYASAVYAGVDQVLPYSSTNVYTTTGTSSTITVSPTLATTGGGMVVSGMHCGNNTTPGKTPGGTDTYLVSNTFTETIDTYTGCSCSASLTGMSVEIAHQTIASASTVAPSYTFAGTPNRQLVIYVNLECKRDLDNSVRLVKAGSIVGSDLAYTVAPWNTVDTYTSYGSSSNLWGTTWTVADVNLSSFGAVFSASVANGTAQVDHMRITITGTSTLPVELLNFFARAGDSENHLYWQTASEYQSKEFIIQRSDGVSDFIDIGVVKGQGNKSVITNYEFLDTNPVRGNSYYRLKQVDLDDSFKYSWIQVVNKNLLADEPMVFPNPNCDGNLSVQAPDYAGSDVQIYSADMKLVRQFRLQPGLSDLAINELTDGVYYMVFYSEGKQKIKKIESSAANKRVTLIFLLPPQRFFVIRML